MADEQKSTKNEKAPDREQAQIKDLPQQEVSKDGDDQVTGGRAPKMNWDIPAGTSSPSS